MLFWEWEQRVKNPSKGSKWATDWMQKLRVQCRGTLFSYLFQFSVCNKGKKKATKHQATQHGIPGLWGVTAGAAIIHWSSLLNFCPGHSSYVDSCTDSSNFSLYYHLYLFLQTLFTSFSLTDYCFPALCSLTFPSAPNCCVCSRAFLTLDFFLPWFLLSSPFSI